MSTHSKPITPASIQQMGVDLHLGTGLPAKERIPMLWKLTVPPELVTECLATNVRHPDLFTGVFDEQGVRASLERIAELAPIAEELRRLMVLLDDELTRARAKAGGDAWALYTQVLAMRHTAAGADLVVTQKAMRSIMRGWRKPRTPKAKAAKTAVTKPAATPAPHPETNSATVTPASPAVPPGPAHELNGVSTGTP